MKKLSLSACLLLGNILCAQNIPNGGFENWSGIDPVSWETSNNNTQSIINVTASANAHSGAKAMRMETWSVQSIVLAAAAACPYNGGFFPVSGQPLSVSGWYSAGFVGGDQAQLLISMRQGSSGIGGGSIVINTSSTSWQQFSFPIIYSSGTPDSAAMGITLQNSSGSSVGLNTGTYFMVDDLQLDSVTGVHEPTAACSQFETISPNPAGTEAMLQYQLAEASKVRLSVLDITGKEIAVLADEQQQAGRFRAFANTSAWADGIYLARLQTAGTVQTMRFCVRN